MIIYYSLNLFYPIYIWSSSLSLFYNSILNYSLNLLSFNYNNCEMIDQNLLTYNYFI